MKSRSQNWKSAILTFVVAVILGALLIRLGPTPQQAQPRQLQSAINELNEQLFVEGVRNAAVRKDETTTAPNNFLYDRSAPAQASHSRKGWVRLPGEVPAALARSTRLPVKIAADATLTLTIILKRKDQAAFDDYFRKVYEPGS